MYWAKCLNIKLLPFSIKYISYLINEKLVLVLGKCINLL